MVIYACLYLVSRDGKYWLWNAQLIASAAAATDFNQILDHQQQNATATPARTASALF
ncbi:hypothetical protein SOP86_18265 [Pseudomonas canadensis]|uniref:hypothetical protein n=1 Tax=Pseudomonas canadensis TaxID=915099 RepID=UPI002B245A33|nr:hypothetical protein [Pseudomonas canadensis]MEB2647587.1 hypothetical protein [Pseudomonas canadensis]